MTYSNFLGYRNDLMAKMYNMQAFSLFNKFYYIFLTMARDLLI